VKILFVSEYYTPHIGGVEVVFRNLAERLVKQGHKCHLVTCRLPDTQKYEDINGVKVHRISVPHRGARYWFSFLAIPSVIKMARKADIVHTTTYNAIFPAWLAARLTGTKSLVTVHEVWDDLWLKLASSNSFMARCHRCLEKILVRLPFNATVCVSGYTHNCLKGFGKKEEELKVIHNGIDNDVFNPSAGKDKKSRKELNLPEDVFIYTYYGRPGVSKGVEYLVMAVPSILKKIPGAKLLLILAHDPPDRYRYITELIRNLRIQESVILLDPVPLERLVDYIAASDCVVVPSLSEGFGFSAAEACAMGKPVVASNVASLPEVVSGEYILVQPADPEAIAEGVERVYKGDIERIERKTFNWDKSVAQYLEVYKEITAGEQDA